MLINLSHYAEAKKAQERAERQALQAAEKAEIVSRANLEWILADLLADIEAA